MLRRNEILLFTCFGILFGVLALQWAGIFFQTGIAPHQTTIPAFNGIHVHVGLWWADLLIIPVIWSVLLFRFALPSPYGWDMCPYEGRWRFRIHMILALVAGLAASVFISGNHFTFEVILMSALVIASSGIFWAIGRGATSTVLGGWPPELEDWTPDLARGSMGIVMTAPIALFCGSFAGLVHLVVFGVVYGTFFWMTYGIAALWRFIKSLRIPRTVA